MTNEQLRELYNFLYRVTHWQEGKPDLHDMKVMVRETMAAQSGTDVQPAPVPTMVPPGYVLVPVEPTPSMIAAGDSVEDLYRRGTPETWGKVYRAMIAAAPEATN